MNYENGKKCKAIKSCNVSITDYLKQALLGFYIFPTMIMIRRFLLKGRKPSGRRLLKMKDGKNYLKLQKNLYAVYIVSAVLQSMKSEAAKLMQQRR